MEKLNLKTAAFLLGVTLSPLAYADSVRIDDDFPSVQRAPATQQTYEKMVLDTRHRLENLVSYRLPLSEGKKSAVGGAGVTLKPFGKKEDRVVFRFSGSDGDAKGGVLEFKPLSKTQVNFRIATESLFN